MNIYKRLTFGFTSKNEIGKTKSHKSSQKISRIKSLYEQENRSSDCHSS